MSASWDRLSPPQSSKTTWKPHHAEIDAISWSVVYPQFRNTAPQGLAVTKVAGLESGDPGNDPRLCPHVLKVIQPLGDDFPTFLGSVAADDIHAYL